MTKHHHPLPTWQQPALFDGGRTLVTCEMTWHLNGPLGTIDLGYSIADTTSGAQIELGTLGSASIHMDTFHLLDVLSEIHRRAMKELAPF